MWFFLLKFLHHHHHQPPPAAAAAVEDPSTHVPVEELLFPLLPEYWVEENPGPHIFSTLSVSKYRLFVFRKDLDQVTLAALEFAISC